MEHTLRSRINAPFPLLLGPPPPCPYKFLVFQVSLQKKIMYLLIRNLLRKDFVTVEEKGNAKLLNFREAMFEWFINQSASKYTMDG